ncbi:hypothetical protein [Xylophilus sp.]|nr:hypothetical protein [Xylophilus sp.]KAF1046192.1 MAG: hypothetical protein GAK38_02589 [Xylophilus sp.]
MRQQAALGRQAIAGLPMGVQVIGAYGDDEQLLRVAEFVGRAAC